MQPAALGPTFPMPYSEAREVRETSSQLPVISQPLGSHHSAVERAWDLFGDMYFQSLKKTPMQTFDLEIPSLQIYPEETIKDYA